MWRWGRLSYVRCTCCNILYRLLACFFIATYILEIILIRRGSESEPLSSLRTVYPHSPERLRSTAVQNSNTKHESRN